MQLKRVVFPAPLGPMTEKISPLFMVKPISSRALIPPKEMDRESTRKKAGSILFNIHPFRQFFSFSVSQALDYKSLGSSLAGIHIILVIGFEIDLRTDPLEPFYLFHFRDKFFPCQVRTHVFQCLNHGFHKQDTGIIE